MRLLADECCSRHVVEALRGEGFDVVWIAEIAPGTTDEGVLALAREQGRILITEDYDFGRLALEAIDSPAVILTALGSLSPRARADRLLEALRDEPEFSGWFTIVEPRRLRRRRL